MREFYLVGRQYKGAWVTRRNKRISVAVQYRFVRRFLHKVFRAHIAELNISILLPFIIS